MWHRFRPALATAAMLVMLLAVFSCGAGGGRTTFHVAPGGDDSGKGLKTAPFATPARAVEAAAELRAQKPENGVVIDIAPGRYTIEETIVLAGDVSGTESAPLTITGAGGVVFSGGMIVDGFTAVTDEDILDRLAPEARESVMAADLGKLGIRDYGDVNPAGGRRIELFYKESFMTIARYPDEGWLTIADVPQTGERMIHPGLDRDKSAVPRGRHYGRFTYDGDRPDRWKDDDDIWVHGYWTWDWSDQYLPVAKIDRENREITPAEPHHGYGYTKEQRFCFLNIIEELDTPGEWYLDRDTGMLYFWPPDELRPGDCVISILEEPMLVIDGADFVTISGVTFAESRGEAVRIDSGSNNTIAGCGFRNLGRTAVTIDGGAENQVLSCDFFDLASGGIILNGGDHATLEPAGNAAVNNHIHHYDIRLKTYRPGIQITGVGNRAAHNLIHDAPHIGIFLSTSNVGNDHIIEYNELHSLAKETGDVGAIYLCSRDYSFWGNVVRYNYLHHLHGPGHWGVQGVYLDDFTGGTEVHGNIFHQAGRGTLIGGGRSNRIENNIYIDCQPSIHLDGRGLGWAKYYFEENRSKFKELLEAVDYRNPPYSERYPELLTLLDDDPAVPKHNIIRRNISTSGIFFDLNDRLDFDVFTMERNIIGGSTLCRWVREGYSQRQVYGQDHAEVRAVFEERDNILTGDEPLFVSPENGDFSLRDPSLGESIGFEPIPLEKIGLYPDEYRTTLPAASHTAGR